jgi:environmental stress-induced protein Ves
MRIIRSSEYRVMPWKNGGGATTEMYVSPNGAGPFNWRVSIATVNANGPFSAFNGYERHIMVLPGAGMTLDVEGRGKIGLEPLRPFTFSGDAGVYGTLPSGPVLDFNLMVCRDFGHGTLHVVEGRAGDRLGSEAVLHFIYVLQGEWVIGNERLRPNDSFCLEMGECVSLSVPLKLVICAITPRLQP